MKKIITLSAIALFSFATSQITLEHTFDTTMKEGRIYSYDDDTFYYFFDDNDKSIKIYNSDFSLRKQINVNVPTGYSLSTPDYDEQRFIATKNIFNTDNLYEFIVYLRNESSSGGKLFIINENSNIIYDFGDFPFVPYVELFNDKVAGKNKLSIHDNTTQKIYSLPTSQLSTQELGKLSTPKAYPNPASSEVNIPLNSKQNGILRVYNSSGQIIENKTIHSKEDYYKLPLNKYSKGVYLYEYNGDKGKFIVK